MLRADSHCDQQKRILAGGGAFAKDLERRHRIAGGVVLPTVAAALHQEHVVAPGRSARRPDRLSGPLAAGAEDCDLFAPQDVPTRQLGQTSFELRRAGSEKIHLAFDDGTDSGGQSRLVESRELRNEGAMAVDVLHPHPRCARLRRGLGRSQGRQGD